ncbi:MAG TPA: C69 family dipeptidase, partial [Bacillota bacterium]|nr:C69 family dipeptidase [Bacillota bacterium]
MRKNFMLGIVVLALVMALTVSAIACTDVPVSKGASAGGYVMTTWTDDSGSDNTRVNVVPAKDWPAGSMRTVLRNTDYGQFENILEPIFSPGEIPQVAHTYQYINASYSFMNECGVGIGESTIGGNSKMRNINGWFDIVELQRIALERGKTAREVVLIMGDLAEKYGYGIGGECLTVVDKDDCWVFEVFGPGPLWQPGCGEPGAVWAAVRMPEGYAGVCANRSRIGEVHPEDTANYLCSKHIFSLAEEMGLWDPKSGNPFKVYETYGKKAYSPYNARREWRVLDLLAPSMKLDPWSEQYPFAVKP